MIFSFQEKRMLESQAKLARKLASAGRSSSPEAGAVAVEDDGNQASGTQDDHSISGINGAVVTLTDEQMRDPAIKTKYQ